MSIKIASSLVQQIADTSENLKFINPLMPDNVVVYETDTGLSKIGNSGNHYNDLPYIGYTLRHGTEQLTNEIWVNNKPIYSFVIVIREPLLTTGGVTYPLGIDGDYNIVQHNVYIRGTEDEFSIHLPYVDFDSGISMTSLYDVGNIVINSNFELNEMNIIIFVKYTR